MGRSVKASDIGISRLQNARSTCKDKKTGRPLSYEGLAEKTGMSSKTVKRFFKGIFVDQGYARAIIQALGLNEQGVLSLEANSVSEVVNEIELKNTNKSASGNELVEKLGEGLQTLGKAEHCSLKAMEWLESHRGGLAQEAARSVLNNGNAEELNEFSAEIRRHLQLIYDCLEIGTWDFMIEAMRQDPPPVTREARLYSEALSFIKKQKVEKELLPESTKEIVLCLDYLIRTLPVMY